MFRHIVDERRQACGSVSRGCLGTLHVDAHREFLAELDAELIEGIHSPDRALYEHAVLVQGQEPSQGSRGGLRVQQQGARPVALVRSMWPDALNVGRAGACLAHLRLDVLERMSEGKGLRL